MTRPLRPPGPRGVSAGWSATADAAADDDPAPAAAPPRARTSPPRPSTRQPRRPAAAAEAPVGYGAPRTAQTGKPRVDWQAYDTHAYATAPEWILYRLWTTVPIDGRWYARAWEHLLAFLFGRRMMLLWVGISMRAAIARWTEHLADKDWRRLIHMMEIDPSVVFDTEKAAEAYEAARIAAECPRYNRKGNDRAYNPGAIHLTKRVKAQHLADWHHQAGRMAAGWALVAAVCAWMFWPDTMPADMGARAGLALDAVVAGIGAGAALLMFGRIMRLAIMGAQPTTAQRNRIRNRR
jgi:hypothetical protein